VPACDACLANDALDFGHLLHPEPIALRVARLNARTRSGPSVVVRSAGARREASPHACLAADA
jgi:hypothetical protein